MIPIRDNYNNGKQAWGVLGICIILCLVSFYVWLGQEDMIVNKLGFIPMTFTAHPWKQLGTLISASFLHGDIYHLLGNCIFLWVFGCSLEKLFGWKLVLLSFPLAGISGFLLHWIFNVTDITPVIGASAAISTFLGIYLAVFPHAKIKSILILGWFFRLIDVPAWIFILYWALLQLGGAFLAHQWDSVAYYTHIGGFILGLIVGVFWKVTHSESESLLAEFNQK